MAVSVTRAIMENIGLSSEEAKLYEAILLNGILTPGEISVYIEFPIDKVESLLEKLEKKQIVRKLPGIVVRYSIAPPFKELGEILDTFRKEAESLRKNIDQKFKETLTDLENSVTTWKSDVGNIIVKEFDKISSENTATAKNLEKFSLQTSRTLEKDAEKSVKEISTAIEHQSELYSTRINEYGTGLGNILDIQVEKSEKEKEIREKDLTERIDSNIKYHADNIQGVNENINKTLSENSETLLESLNQLKAKNIDLVEKSLLKFDELANEVKNKAFSVLYDYQNGFAADVKELLSSIDSSFRDQVNVREENLGLLQSSIEQNILENSIENAKTLSNFHYLTSKALNRLYKRYEKDVVSISEKLNELINTGYTRSSSIIEGIKTSIDGYLESHIKSLSGEYIEFQKEFVKTVDAGNKNLVAAKNNLEKYYTDILNQELSINTKTAENLKDSISESIKKNIQEINSKLENIQNYTKENLQSELEAYNNNLINIQNTVFTSLDDSKSSLLNSAQTVSRNMLQDNDSEIKGFENTVNNIREKLSESKNLNLEEINREAERFKKDFEDTLKKRAGSIENYAQEIKRQTSEVINSRLNWMSASFELLQKQITGVIDDIIAKSGGSINKTGVQNLKDFSKVINDHLESFKKDAGDINSSIKSNLDQRFSEFETGVQNIKESFLKTIAEKIISISQSSARLLEDAEKVLNEQSKETSKLSHKLDTSITGNLKHHIDEFDAKITEVKKVTENTVNSGINKFQENITNLLNTIDSSLSKNFELIKKTDDKIQSELASKIYSILEENQNSVSNLKNVAEQNIKSNLEYVEDEINKLKNNFSSTINNRLEESKVENEKLTGNIHEKIDGEKQALEGLISNLFDEASSTLNDHISNTKETIVNSRESLLENVSELIKIIREAKERAIENTLENKQSELENYKNKMEILNEEIVALMKKQQEKLVSDTETAKLEKEETIQKVIEENNSIITSTRKETEEIINSNSQSIEETLKVTRASLTNTIENYIKENEDQAESLKSSLVESLNNYMEELHDTILNSKKESSLLIKIQLEDYNKTISEAKEKLVDAITNYSQTLKETVGEIQNKLSESLSKHENDVKKTTEKIQENLNSNLENTENNISTYVNEASSTVAKLFIETEKHSSETAALLTAAWEALEKSKPKEVQKTWHLVTKESIITHIIDMIRRASKTITIIIPNISDIPIKEITGKAESVRIHLITDFSEKQKKEITEISKKKIRVWKRSESDLYGCIRDQRETLLAPSLTTEIPVAVVSEEEGYARVYQNIILPNLIAKAEEIRV